MESHQLLVSFTVFITKAVVLKPQCEISEVRLYMKAPTWKDQPAVRLFREAVSRSPEDSQPVSSSWHWCVGASVMRRCSHAWVCYRVWAWGSEILQIVCLSMCERVGERLTEALNIFTRPDTARPYWWELPNTKCVWVAASGDNNHNITAQGSTRFQQTDAILEFMNETFEMN